MQTITVYKSADAMRVVAGEHQAHAGSNSQRVAVYPDARLAYAVETDADVRSAILRIAPDAAGATTRLERVPLAAIWEAHDRVAPGSVCFCAQCVPPAAGVLGEVPPSC